jgi:tRNA-dihydrouridine synthase
MIGRAALGNPFVFNEIKQYLNGKKPSEITIKDKISAAKKHLRYFEEFYGRDAHLGEMKKHLSWYIKGFENCSQIRAEIVKCKTADDARHVFEIF